MHKFILSAVAASLAMFAAPAIAQTVGGGLVVGAIGGGFEAGESVSFDAKGSAEGMSSSGFQQATKFGADSIAAFGSIGVAGSSVAVTPFSVDTDSYHAGAFVGGTFGDAKMNGQVMNFGQSEGKGSFDIDTSAFQNTELGFGVIGGFGAFSF